MVVSQPTVARCSMRWNQADELGERWCSEMERPGSLRATLEQPSAGEGNTIVVFVWRHSVKAGPG